MLAPEPEERFPHPDERIGHVARVAATSPERQRLPVMFERLGPLKAPAVHGADLSQQSGAEVRVRQGTGDGEAPPEMFERLLPLTLLGVDLADRHVQGA